MPQYAELHCLSNFSFLRGASHAEELITQAKALGYTALAITDECSLAGVVRAHTAAKKAGGIKLLIGAEFTLDCGLRLVIIARNRAGYGRLSRLITRGRRRAAKGSYSLGRADVEEFLCRWRDARVTARDAAAGSLALWLPPLSSRIRPGRARGWRATLRDAPGSRWSSRATAATANAWAWRVRWVRNTACRSPPPATCTCICANAVALQDALTAVRHGVTLAEAGERLFANGERHLRERERLAGSIHPALLAETVKIAALADFSLDELRYEYPRELVPPGETPASHLRKLTEAGALRRWPAGVPQNMRTRIDYELALIADLRYESYFLTVHDIVSEARRLSILCQGRGSAANSVVCYCLGVTEVDPSRGELLMERFISRERNEPPDIDIDFEHERREEVIQYIYRKYGRDRTALTATVICYRPRSALRDMAKAMGLDAVQAERLAGAMQWWDTTVDAERIREAGFEPGQSQGAATAVPGRASCWASRGICRSTSAVS